MPDLLHGSSGQQLSLDEYWRDFDRLFWTVRAPGFWKLERQQTFAEPSNPSWVAFAKGDWDEALRRLDTKRDELAAYHQKIAEFGFRTHRVRVVEQPVTAYLQWELHVLRLRDELGGAVRVVDPDAIRHFEGTGPLPEIYTLGTDVMYQAIYAADGTLDSAVRYVDRDLVIRCQRFIQDLYAAGEPLAAFFRREIAGLAPPRGEVTHDRRCGNPTQ